MSPPCLRLLWLAVGFAAGSALAQPFQLPTANRHLFERDGGGQFFVGTTGKPWTSGTFGCVRSSGNKFHEGLDIRALQRDRRGESTDAVMATAAGTVAYVSTKPSLSNYGNYIVLRHQVEGLEIYSLYAHLRAVRDGLKAGQSVRAGEVIATLGRTSNTGEGISRDRAHLHFELNLFVNERFSAWYRKHCPGQRDDHGIWNGRNLLGLDPAAVFLAQQREGTGFSLLRFVQSRPELCRVFIRQADFPFVRRYAALIRRNPRAEREGVAGYELALTFNGLPLQLTPRTAAEVPGRARFQLLSVNAEEARRHAACHLVTSRGSQWTLAQNGQLLLELLAQ